MLFPENEARVLRDANHDLKQPVIAFKHHLHLFARNLDITSQSGPVREIFQYLSEGIRRFENMVDDIIHFAKITTGPEKPKLVPISTCDFNTEIYTEFAELASAKNIKIRTRPDDMVMLSDPKILFRIVSNLVRNAIVHTTAGRVRLIFRDMGRSGPGCAVEVWDCGESHDADDFDDFVRQKEAESQTRGEGFGLGLRIIKRLSESIGAPVTLHRRPGGGSAFWLRIPVIEGATAADFPALAAQYAGGGQ